MSLDPAALERLAAELTDALTPTIVAQDDVEAAFAFYDFVSEGMAERVLAGWLAVATPPPRLDVADVAVYARSDRICWPVLAACIHHSQDQYR